MEGDGLVSTHPEHAQQPAATARRHPQHVIKRTRTGGVWAASVLFALVLALLLIFILENGQRASISYFGAHAHLPLGVALLFAAVLGIVMVVIPGTARIVQLRIAARRHRRDGGHAGHAPAERTCPRGYSGPRGAGGPSMTDSPNWELTMAGTATETAGHSDGSCR
jgi:uncharacterized integral membrane protein